MLSLSQPHNFAQEPFSLLPKKMHSLLPLLFHQSDGICIHYQWRVLQFRFGRNREAILTILRDSVVCEVFRGLDTPGQKAMRIDAAKDKNPPNVYILDAATLFSNEPALTEYLSLWGSRELNDLCKSGPRHMSSSIDSPQTKTSSNVQWRLSISALTSTTRWRLLS